MNWDELRTRGMQEVNKRIDLAAYRAGLVSTVKRKKAPLRPASFFFSPQDLPSLSDSLKTHLPNDAEEIFRDADRVCNHRFRLLGYEWVDYGLEIDWHLDALHGKRAPFKPWFKIPFLDFSAVGDHKVIWELNRHQHLVTLAKAWVLTGEERYAAEAISQWYTWQVANPFPIGINWASSLEVSFRSLAWLWMKFLLAEFTNVPAGFQDDLSRALAISGRYVERYLSTYFSPNTHLLGEATALFFIGTLCPELPSAGRWRTCGWRILLQEADRQVRGDGVHFEHSLYYHVYALDFFLHARILAALNGMRIPAAFDATLKRMLRFLAAVSQGGPPESFGDEDGGRVFNPRRNRSQHLTDPLSVGAVVFGPNDFGDSPTLTEEALWLFGPSAAAHLARPTAEPNLIAASFADSGVYVSASSEPFPQRVVVQGGALGEGRAGHGHAHALSVTLAFGGYTWLADSGTFCYSSPDHERDTFRGTAAHNTVRVDELDQADPDGPFAWKSLPNVQVEKWVSGSTFSLFEGNQDGYVRLPDPVVHRRSVFHLYGGFWLVSDVLDGRQEHTIESNWHYAPELQIRETDGVFVASWDPAYRASPLRLALIPLQDSGLSCELVRAEISPAYGIKRSAPILRVRGKLRLPSILAALIAPLAEVSTRPGEMSFLTGECGRKCGLLRGYRYKDSVSTHYLVFSCGHGAWTLGPYTSDARFLYCRIRESRLEHFIVCNGSSVVLNGESVLHQARTIERFEWINRQGASQVFSSDDRASTAFFPDAFHNCSPVF
jgi:hypothetical protein